jgi:hypothetical protein
MKPLTGVALLDAEMLWIASLCSPARVFANDLGAPWIASAKANARPKLALNTRRLYPRTSRPKMCSLDAKEAYGYAIAAARRTIAAVRGSKGRSVGTFLLVADPASGAFEAEGAVVGLKEMRFPTKAGAMRVGIAQWSRTSQNVEVWKTDSGGYGRESVGAEGEMLVGERGTAAYFQGITVEMM